MKRLVPRSRNAAEGFTLLEVLVSIAILTLIMVAVAQMMNSALKATASGYKHLDADTQARMVLDRMAYDISRIVKRTDIDYYFQKNATAAGTPNFGNDQMAFYSESGGYYNGTGTTTITDTTKQSNVSLVGYMIAPMLNGTYTAVASGGVPQLVRLSKGLTWNGTSASYPAMVFNPLANATIPLTAAAILKLLTNNTITSTAWNGATNAIVSGKDPNYQVIGDQIFRLEYYFLVQSPPTAIATGTTGSSILTPGTTVPGFYDYPWCYSPAAGYQPAQLPYALKDVTAIVVSIAVLDSRSRANVTGTVLSTSAAKLSDDSFATMTTSATAPSVIEAATPLSLWRATLNTAITSGTATPLGLPKAAAAQIRFYQRTCYLNHLQ